MWPTKKVYSAITKIEKLYIHGRYQQQPSFQLLVPLTEIGCYPIIHTKLCTDLQMSVYVENKVEICSP